MNARTMTFLSNAGLLPGLLEIHVNIDWPRFIFAMFVLASILGYLIYSWVKR